MRDDEITIRSYRRVFRLERRIYRVDRWHVPRPGGVSVRAVTYFLVAMGMIALLDNLPLIGVALDPFPFPLRYVVAPAAVAMFAMNNVEVMDGRAPHAWAWSWLCRRVEARRPVRSELDYSGRMGVRWDEHVRTDGKAWTVKSMEGDGG